MQNSEILKRFAVVCVITIVVVTALTTVLVIVAGFDIGGGAGIVSFIVPAMDAGRNHARRTRTALTKGRMWKLAMLFTLVCLAIGVVLLIVLSLVAPLGLMQMLTAVGPLGLLLIMLFIFALYIVIGRISLGFGQRSELKRQQKTDP